MLLTSKYNARSSAKFFSTSSFITVVMNLWITIWVYIFLISQVGDVQFNPGPKDKSSSAFSICHWNFLNSITAHSYAKISLLKAYIADQNFNVVCISETSLDSSTAYDDSNLEIAGRNLIRSDHPSNKKRGGVCIYYKNSLPLRYLSIHYLQACINFELKIDHKSCNFISLYRSPSQSLDEFEKFCENLERNLNGLLQNNLFLVVVVGDFNVKSNNWYCCDKSSLEGDTFDTITKQYGLHQIIREPTHILDNTSSCINLIFTSQPNFKIESGVRPSLHPNCHLQIVYAKFNLQIYFPPPYLQEVWHYKDANTELIKKAISKFN